MIKKLIFIVTVCLFAAGSIINMHLAQNDHNTDFSLADISVMAQADGEAPGWGDPAPCYWHYEKKFWYNGTYIIVCGVECCREKVDSATFLDTCTYVGCDNT